MAIQVKTDTEFYQNYERCMREIMDGDEIIITRDGREIARAIAPGKNVSFIADSLLGILKQSCGDKSIGEQRALRHEGIA